LSVFAEGEWKMNEQSERETMTPAIIGLVILITLLLGAAGGAMLIMQGDSRERARLKWESNENSDATGGVDALGAERCMRNGLSVKCPPFERPGVPAARK
jgi:hypothetical protein